MAGRHQLTNGPVSAACVGRRGAETDSLKVLLLIALNTQLGILTRWSKQATTQESRGFKKHSNWQILPGQRDVCPPVTDATSSTQAFQKDCVGCQACRYSNSSKHMCSDTSWFLKAKTFSWDSCGVLAASPDSGLLVSFSFFWIELPLLICVWCLLVDWTKNNKDWNCPKEPKEPLLNRSTSPMS